MSSELTFEDQIRESKRVRVWGEFPQDLLVEKSERDQISIPLNSLSAKQQENTLTSDIPSIRWELISAKNPFALSFEDFINLGLIESEELLKIVHDSCKDLLKEAWRNGYRQAVICNRKIVFQTTKTDDISDEVERLAKKYDKACYVFSAPDVIEESAWTPISGDDFYPTLSVYIGTEDSDEKNIIEKSSPICADLDTGNPFYKIFNANQLVKPLTDFTPLQMRSGEHLGRSYTYYNKRVKICVKDTKGNINSITCNVRLVRHWDGCALLQTSPNRVGFIGRDILRDLRIRLKLDSIEKTTQILDVSS